MVSLTERGLYCEAGNFYIDPWEAVDRAVVTHAHADHLCAGSRVYVTAAAGAPLGPRAPRRRGSVGTGGLRRDDGARRRASLIASGGAHPGLGASAHRTRG